MPLNVHAISSQSGEVIMRIVYAIISVLVIAGCLWIIWGQYKKYHPSQAPSPVMVAQATETGYVSPFTR